ncbi:MAG: hypothetical protein ACOC56_06880 [Atribacterota bacterium]
MNYQDIYPGLKIKIGDDYNFFGFVISKNNYPLIDVNCFKMDIGIFSLNRYQTEANNLTKISNKTFKRLLYDELEISRRYERWKKNNKNNLIREIEYFYFLLEKNLLKYIY